MCVYYKIPWGKQDVPIVISKEHVLKSLKMVKMGKAAGPDDISGNIISLCGDPLTTVLCKIFQQSIRNILHTWSMENIRNCACS